MSKIAILRWVVLLLGMVIATEALAQAPGTVSTQSRDVTPRGGGGNAPETTAGADQIDFREEMRKFVQSISAYGRASNPNFAVLTVNGFDLLSKPLEGDETQQFPARTYLRSLDGVIQEGLFHGIPTLDSAPVPERRLPIQKALEIAKAARVQVLTVDYGRTTAVNEASIRQSRALGFLPFVATERPITRIPSFPQKPIDENPRTITALKDVKNFLYLPEPAGYGREDEYVLTLHENNYDMLIVDVFNGRSALSKRAVETLKFKKLGAKRLVLARVNIGTADSDRYYWKPNWHEGNPNWVNAPYPGNPDRYYVEFWRPEWKQIISGTNTSYLYGILQQGFDGVVLEGVEAYRFFEGTTQTPDVTF
jgi:endo-alpha-1,4-polygalactosaminidase (GH114 family)